MTRFSTVFFRWKEVKANHSETILIRILLHSLKLLVGQKKLQKLPISWMALATKYFTCIQSACLNLFLDRFYPYLPPQKTYFTLFLTLYLTWSYRWGFPQQKHPQPLSPHGGGTHLVKCENAHRPQGSPHGLIKDGDGSCIIWNTKKHFTYWTSFNLSKWKDLLILMIHLVSRATSNNDGMFFEGLQITSDAKFTWFAQLLKFAYESKSFGCKTRERCLQLCGCRLSWFNVFAETPPFAVFCICHTYLTKR